MWGGTVAQFETSLCPSAGRHAEPAKHLSWIGSVLAPSTVAMRARSFGSEVPKDDSVFGEFARTEPGSIRRNTKGSCPICI